MTIDEFVLELRSFEVAPAMPTARCDELVALFVRSDVEAGETQDQWVVLEADEDGGGIQLTRFFAFGDDDGDDLNDAGVLLDVEYEDGQGGPDYLAGAVVGAATTDDRVTADEWVARVAAVLAATSTPPTATTVFG